MNNDSEKEKNKKTYLRMYSIILCTVLIYFGILYFSIKYLEEGFLLGTIILISTTAIVFISFYALKKETETGYFECRKCHERFYPTSIFRAMFAARINSSRFLKCPECNQRSWARKVMSKDKED